MNRAKLKKGTLLLAAGALGAPGCCPVMTFGSLSEPCCNDAGLNPEDGSTSCEPSCYGVAVKPPDAGNDAGIVGFFSPDGGKGDDGGADAG